MAVLMRYIQSCTLGIFLIEVIPTSDPRAEEDRFQLVMKMKTIGRPDRNCFSEILDNDLANTGNILNTCFVFTLKRVGTKDERTSTRPEENGHSNLNNTYLI